jgi:two-component system, NtrC family, sensor kinase
MRTRIGTRLILGAGLVTAAVIGIMATLTVRNHTDQLIFERTRSANQLSETIKRSTHYDMLENRRENLHRQIQTIGDLQQEGIRKVRLFNKEGKIMFSSEGEEIGTGLDKRAEACYACHAEGRPLEKLDIQAKARIFRAPDGTRVLGIINAIPNEPSCWKAACHAHSPKQSVLGVLDVNVSLAEADREIVRSRVLIVGLATLAILAGSLMIWWLTKLLVLRPVLALVEGTRRVSEGDLTTTIPSTARHELGVLARAFNTMTSKLSETQRQLTQADRLASVGRLAAGVAHEINNPLTGVLTYASLLQKRPDMDASAQEDLGVIVRETKRCRAIVRELLDFARPTPPARKPTDLNEVVSHALSVVTNQLSENQVRLLLELTPNLPRASADANQLEQVIVNLFLNAADAIGPEGGDLRVSTRVRAEVPPVVELIVSDTGGGIPAEDLPRLFEPFFTTKGPRGTGLGLAVSWGIIESHGGSIDVQSEPGRGTVFTVSIPLASPTGKHPIVLDPIAPKEEAP